MLAAGPRQVRRRPHEQIRVAQMCREQDPEPVEQRQRPESLPQVLGHVLSLICAGGEPLHPGALRHDARRKIHRQEHAHRAEERPYGDLVHEDELPPEAPAVQVLGGDREHDADR
jgi:hypothetical protein